MLLDKRRLMVQLLQSSFSRGTIVDHIAANQLMGMELICWRNKLEYSTKLTDKGKRLLQELEATWENQT